MLGCYSWEEVKLVLEAITSSLTDLACYVHVFPTLQTLAFFKINITDAISSITLLTNMRNISFPPPHKYKFSSAQLTRYNSALFQRFPGEFLTAVV